MVAAQRRECTKNATEPYTSKWLSFSWQTSSRLKKKNTRITAERIRHGWLLHTCFRIQNECSKKSELKEMEVGKENEFWACLPCKLRALSCHWIVRGGYNFNLSFPVAEAKWKTWVLPKFAVKYSENALLKVGRIFSQDSPIGHL